MKKQEEFEMTQDKGTRKAWNNDRHIPTDYTIPLQISTAETLLTFQSYIISQSRNQFGSPALPG